jgi:hypothetical protein
MRFLVLLFALTDFVQDRPRTGAYRIDVKSGSYAVYVPSGYDHVREYPMLVWLHGSRNTGEGNRDSWITYLKNLRRQEEFILVMPHMESLASGKSGPGDLQVAMESVEDAHQRFKISRNRVILSSHSGGGPPSHQLLARQPNSFAMFAPWSNNHYGAPPVPKEFHDKPILLMWGARDHELIIAKDAFGTGGQGPGYHASLSSQPLKRYQRLVVPDHDHSLDRRIAATILAFYDQSLLDQSMSTPLRATWDKIRAFAWADARKEIERSKPDVKGLDELKARFEALQKALDASIAGASDPGRKLLWLKLAAQAWRGSPGAKELSDRAKEAEKGVNAGVIGKCAELLINSSRAGRVQAEKDLRALRGSDRALGPLIDECVNRLWLDAFGLAWVP